MPHSPLVLAFGDSLIAGYGLAAADGFAAQLERRMQSSHPGATVINAGVSGDTTADAVRRLPRLLSRLSARPDLAIVQLGPNDVLQQVPSATTRANLDAILTELGRCGVTSILTSVDAPAFLADRARSYVGIQPDLAARHGATLIPFFPPGILGHPDMVLLDRVHPNAKAIAAVVDRMLPVILAATARASAGV